MAALLHMVPLGKGAVLEPDVVSEQVSAVVALKAQLTPLTQILQQEGQWQLCSGSLRKS